MHLALSDRTWMLFEGLAFSLLTGALLYVAIQRVSVSKLRSLQPWASAAGLLMWLLCLVAMVGGPPRERDRGLLLAVMMAYLPVSLASGWIRSRIQFADPPNWKTRRMGRLLRIPSPTYVEIENPSAAEWYVERLGLRRLAPSDDADPKTIRMKFSADTEEMRLGPRDPLSLGGTIMLYSRRLKRAKEALSDNGIHVGPIQVDRQGTSYFEFRDPEGNTIEVCEPR